MQATKAGHSPPASPMAAVPAAPRRMPSRKAHRSPTSPTTNPTGTLATVPPKAAAARTSEIRVKESASVARYTGKVGTSIIDPTIESSDGT